MKQSQSNFASIQCEIAIKVTQISNFSKFKVQSFDIATLLGAEGPQQGPKGPKPSTGARRMGAQCPDLLILIYFAYFWGGLNMTHKQTDSLTNRKGNKDKAQISAGYSQNHPKHAFEKLCSSFYILTKWSYTTQKNLQCGYLYN